MLSVKRSDRARARRAFTFSAFESEYRLESKFLTAPWLTRVGGLNRAIANANTLPALIDIDTDPSNVLAMGTNYFAIPAGLGAGSLTTSNAATVNVGTASGPMGGAGFSVNGALNGVLAGSVDTGFLTGGAGANVASQDAAGNNAPLTWNLTETPPDYPNEPIVTTRTLTAVFQMSGTDGINPTTNVGVMGGFNLNLLMTTNGGSMLINMNTQGVRGVEIQTNPNGNDPFGWTTVYTSPPNSDGSADGVIGPGGSTEGSFAFGAAYTAILPIPANGPITVQYAAGFNMAVTPALMPGQHIDAIPSMQWTFNVGIS